MRAAAACCLFLLTACRVPPEAAATGTHHTLIVAAHPRHDAERAGLSLGQLDEVDDLLLPRLDWTAALETGDRVHVLVGDDGHVRAVRIDSARVSVAGAIIDGRALRDDGAPVPEHRRLRPLATRDLVTYPVVAFDNHDPVRVERGDNGVFYGAASGAVLTATNPGEVHVLACWGRSIDRTCEIEVWPSDGPELWILGSFEPLAKTGDVVRAGAPLGVVNKRGRHQVRYGIVDKGVPRRHDVHQARPVRDDAIAGSDAKAVGELLSTF